MAMAGVMLCHGRGRGNTQAADEPTAGFGLNFGIVKTAPDPSCSLLLFLALILFQRLSVHRVILTGMGGCFDFSV